MENDRISKKNGGASGNPFETATLAEIYIRQGFLEKGLKIYRRLAGLDPGNSFYDSKIAELSDRIKGADGASKEPADKAPVSVPERPGVSEGRLPGLGEQSVRDVSRDKERILDTLNQWLSGARKRKKHVQKNS